MPLEKQPKQPPILPGLVSKLHFFEALFARLTTHLSCLLFNLLPAEFLTSYLLWAFPSLPLPPLPYLALKTHQLKIQKLSVNNFQLNLKRWFQKKARADLQLCETSLHFTSQPDTWTLCWILQNFSDSSANTRGGETVPVRGRFMSLLFKEAFQD